MTRIGILTGGGDAPGLNAVIRAAVKSAILVHGYEMIGIRNGFEGLLEADGILPLDLDAVRGILPQGGTILGAANRGNPFARRVMRNGLEIVEDVSDQVLDRIRELNLASLLVVGGDGTLRISMELCQKGCPVIGVPKTIDNDVGGTDLSFGFDTAVSIATEAIDRLHTTAEAHHRVMVLELMGRDAGFIALHAGIAGGADGILIPEIPFSFDAVSNKVMARARSGRKFSILAVAEGAFPQGGEKTYLRSQGDVQTARLGGIGMQVGDAVAQTCNMETRVTVLGHLQRGGGPTAFDRWLASRYGAAAVRLAAEGLHGRMVSLQGGTVTHVSLEDALAVPKRVNVNSDAVQTAREMGICMGD